VVQSAAVILVTMMMMMPSASRGTHHGSQQDELGQQEDQHGAKRDGEHTARVGHHGRTATTTHRAVDDWKEHGQEHQIVHGKPQLLRFVWTGKKESKK
jgi:hypothetical protein